MTVNEEIDELYDLLSRRADTLKYRFGGRLPTPSDLPRDPSLWRAKGVYYFFEPGENRTSSAFPRVVRVGSHGGDSSTIESRVIAEHGMNWGRSVFRRHLGAALIRSGSVDSLLPSADRDHWATAWTARHNRFAVHCDRKRLDSRIHFLHESVTAAILRMPCLWVEVHGKDARLSLERESIRLLSNYHRATAPIDLPSASWLGHSALPEEVRLSGLWNVQHVKKMHRSGFAAEFAPNFSRNS